MSDEDLLAVDNEGLGIVMEGRWTLVFCDTSIL